MATCEESQGGQEADSECRSVHHELFWCVYICREICVCVCVCVCMREGEREKGMGEYTHV